MQPSGLLSKTPLEFTAKASETGDKSEAQLDMQDPGLLLLGLLRGLARGLLLLLRLDWGKKRSLGTDTAGNSAAWGTQNTSMQ